ncbi:MAG: site-2 protease family protein [Nitrosopumilus sp.]|uniref:site-2 protease family protein n=1 Tax=Nitrosopumilus sp. TaxID=2024843 RepID=UPI00292E0BE1|nr:site-2 protease family protein [Nitrosopumilus sp.]
MEDDPSQDEIIHLVNSIFEVSDFIKTEFSLEFRIDDFEFSSKFEDLARKLEDLRYGCKLETVDGAKYVIIQKFSPRKQRKWMNPVWTPRILFAIVISFVMIDGYYRTVEINVLVNIGDPFEMAIIYTLSLLGILGVHELGHLIAARHHRLKTTWPYFIPGIPNIPGLPILAMTPTFGAFIQSRGLTINRKILFDVAIAGPIAGLVIAIIVALYGAYTMPVIDTQTINQYVEDGGDFIGLPFGNPLLFKGALAVFDKDDQFFVYTPVLWASWIGFLITFLNLLPAWQLDGGHMARTLLGPKLQRYTTFGSMAVLILLNFWPMALLILVMSSRNPSATLLDDVSPLSRNRKFAYIGIIGLAILCAPLPANSFI